MYHDNNVIFYFVEINATQEMAQASTWKTINVQNIKMKL